MQVRENFSYVNDMLMALHGMFKVPETREPIKANAAILSGMSPTGTPWAVGQ